MKSKLEKIDNKGIWTAHMSDIHQSEIYEDVIKNIDPAANLLVIQGDWMQCHKNERPSKGKIKGLPKTDNGYGELTNWSPVEAAAYINYGTPIPKGQTVDFETIPSGFLNTSSENYEAMHNFFQRVVKDTSSRLERVAETTHQKFKENGLETIIFPGHDNAYTFWMEELFSDMGLSSLMLNAAWKKEDTHFGHYNHFIPSEYPMGVFVNNQRMHNKSLGYSNGRLSVELTNYSEAGILTAPLFILPETTKQLREFIGSNGLDRGNGFDRGYSTVRNYNIAKRALQENFEYILGETPYLVLCSHEGPKEVSDIVHELGGEGVGNGKATENRSMYEQLFAIPNKTDTKIIWVYGNDGFPIAHTQNIKYGKGNVDIKVHHLAELDVKGDTMSTRGGVSYINHRTGLIITPQDYKRM